jgi:hypothetical protein
MIFVCVSDDDGVGNVCLKKSRCLLAGFCMKRYGFGQHRGNPCCFGLSHHGCCCC